MALQILHAPTVAAVAAAATQPTQVAAILSAFGSGDVTILSYGTPPGGGAEVLAHTSTHGPMVADALTPRGWKPGTAPQATTVNVAGATITRQVFRNSSGVDIYSLDGADITPAPLITRAGKRHRQGGRSTANSNLPVDPPAPAVPTTATLSGSTTATVNVAQSYTVTLDAPADQTYTITWSRSDSGTGSATSTITAGQSSVSASSTWAAAGSGRTLDFTISPSLTRAGNPRTVAVADPVAPGAAFVTLPLVGVVDGAALPFTVGHAFRQGDVPAGSSIVMTGASVNGQATIKSTWPDGSARFALLAGTATIASGTASLALAAGAAASGDHLTTAALSALTASIGFGADTATWSGADWTGGIEYPTANWTRMPLVSGPRMSSWTYRKPIGADVHLVAWLEVRLYSTGAVEVLPWIENGYLSVAAPGLKTGRATFTMGGSTRYDSIDDALTPGGYDIAYTVDGSGILSMPHHTRAVLVRNGATSHWLGTDPQVTPQHNLAYLKATKVVPEYHPTSINEPSLAALTTTYNPGRVAYTTAGMGGTGYAQDIGLLPNTSALYLVSADVRAYRAVIATGFSLANYCIHYRDQATNRPLLFADHPNKSTATGTGMPSATGGRAASYASSHSPAACYLPYLLTGWNWFLEEMQFQVTLHYVSRNEAYRKNATYYFWPSAHAAGLGEQSGQRAIAWQLRACAMAAALTPDADTTMRGQFVTVLGYNATKFRAEYTTGDSDNQFGANTLGVAGFEWTGAKGGAGLWQNDFFTASLGLTWDLEVVTDTTKKADLLWLRDFAYSGVVSRLGRTGQADEHPFVYAAQYANVGVGYRNSAATDFTWRTNWGAVFEASAVVDEGITVATEITAGATSVVLNGCAPGRAISANHVVALGGNSYTVASSTTANGSGVATVEFHPPIESGTTITAGTPTWIGGVAPQTITSNTLTGGNIESGGDGLSTSYWGNLQPAIAYAVGHAAIGAVAGYNRMVGSTNWPAVVPQFDDIPVWGIKPRATVPYTLPGSGQSVAIGTNNAMSVYPDASGWTTAAWDYSLFGSYGGGVLVPEYSGYGAYVLAGTGGHGHPDNLGACVFDFSSALWERLDNANGVPLKSMTPWRFTEGEDSNGAPYFEVTGSVVPLPPHPYANAVPLPLGDRGSMAYVIRTAVGAGASPSGASHRFDLATRLWSRLTENVAPRFDIESDSLYDAARNRVWFVSQTQQNFQNLAYLDLSDMTWKTTANGPFGDAALAGFKRVMLHDGFIIKNCGSQGLWLFDPDASATGWIQLTVTGTLPTPTNNRWARFSNGNWYDFAGASASNTLTRIVPPANPKTGTWVVDTITVTGPALPAKTQGAEHYTRLFYVPSLDSLCWIAGGTNAVTLLKPGA